MVCVWLPDNQTVFMKVIPSLDMGESMQIELVIHIPINMYAPQLTSLEILLIIFPMCRKFR